MKKDLSKAIPTERRRKLRGSTTNLELVTRTIKVCFRASLRLLSPDGTGCVLPQMGLPSARHLPTFGTIEPSQLAYIKHVPIRRVDLYTHQIF